LPPHPNQASKARQKAHNDRAALRRKALAQGQASAPAASRIDRRDSRRDMDFYGWRILASRSDGDAL